MIRNGIENTVISGGYIRGGAYSPTITQQTDSLRIVFKGNPSCICFNANLSGAVMAGIRFKVVNNEDGSTKTGSLGASLIDQHRADYYSPVIYYGQAFKGILNTELTADKKVEEANICTNEGATEYMRFYYWSDNSNKPLTIDLYDLWII